MAYVAGLNVNICLAVLLLYYVTPAFLLTSRNQSPTVSSLTSSQPCKIKLGELSIPPANMTPLTYNLAFVSSLTNGGGDAMIGGAFVYAIEVLEELASNLSIPITFTHTVHDVRNVENKAVKIMNELHCYGNVSAFIGPESHCKSAALMATAFKIPYMTYGCVENHNDTRKYYMVNTNPSISYVSKFIVAVLQHYKWSSLWIVTGADLHWQITADHLVQHANANNITINGKTILSYNDRFSPNSLSENPYANVLQSTRERTRVYVFMGCDACLIVFLREMRNSSMTDTGKYVVVATDNDDRDATDDCFYMTRHEGSDCNHLTRKERDTEVKAFRNLLLIKAKVMSSDVQAFETQVIRRSEQPPFNYPVPPPIIHRRPEMGKKVYHLYDATILLGLSVMSLMGIDGADPLNFSQVISHITGRQHCSKQGHNIMIHDNGESEDSYEVKGLIFDHHNKPTLGIIGSFHLEGGKPVYSEEISIWGADQPPKSEPKCGFNGEHCEDTSGQPVWVIAFIVGAVILVLVILGGGLWVIKRFKYEKKLERLLWKIERNSIIYMGPDQIDQMKTPRPRKKESIVNPLSTLLLHDSPDAFAPTDAKNLPPEQSQVGTYKAYTVFVKHLTRKHLELTRPLKTEFQLRKELTHENINRFIGACIDAPKVSIVTEYCSRKSLTDILETGELPPGDMFIESLVTDLINGMTFIHESDLGCHGNLKSSNCLVDKRWTLKVSDFGFSAMGPSPAARGDDDRAFKKLLWTAPEFLQRRFTSSSSYISQNNSSSMSQSLRPSRTFSSLQQHFHSNNNYSKRNRGGGGGSSHNVKAQQKGDLYSFAIILYDLYGQAGPWGRIGLGPREIIDKLLSPSLCEIFRPDTSVLSCDDSIKRLMHSCWANDPDSRPDFKYTVDVKFKRKQKGSLMEVYAENLEGIVKERTEQLRKEKKMTENLLLRMLPRPVADKLMRGQPVQPEQFECVTIYFSDIVGFTQLSAESGPMEVVNLLNDLYTLFDSVIHKFLVYKVETIGDAYMVVSGLPNSIGDSHAGEIASMSLLFVQKLKEKLFTVRGQSDYMLKLRIGIHSGPCCAGVVGLKMPRYCLFGDTVNTANRMESTGEALKIHCSAECKAILDKLGGYHMEERGHTEVKGKGQLLTYFLISEDDHVRQKRLNSLTNSGRCVSASNLDYSGTPLNQRSTRPLSCIPPASPKQHNGFSRSSSLSLPHNHSSSLPFHIPAKNSVAPASLNTSIDSTMSLPFNQNDSFESETLSLTDFRPSTLPRPTVMRQNSLGGCAGKSMSPIAEDPWSPSVLVLDEKGFKFHDAGLGASDTESECDTLLKQMPRVAMRRHNSLQRQNSTEHSPVVSPMLRHSINTPETIL